MDKKIVLVVDDAPSIRAKVRTFIEKMGFDVVEADDGLKALSILEDGVVPDLAFIDVNMPNMNGIEFVQEVAKKKKWSKMRMIIMTTEINSNLKSQARQAGVRLWVMKPVKGERVRRAIKIITDMN